MWQCSIQQNSFTADDNRKQHIHSTEIDISRQLTAISQLKRHLTGLAGHDRSKDSSARASLPVQTSDVIGRPPSNKKVDHQTPGHNVSNFIKSL
jgi:hypothetical protein